MKKKGAVAVAALALADWLTKLLCVRLLPSGGVSLIKGVMRLELVYNTGTAFSILADKPAAALLLSGCVLFALTAYTFAARLTKHEFFPLCGVLAGGIANFVDRLRDGMVTDMLMTEFISFPVFNLADVCITVGCAWFAIACLAGKH